MQERGQTPDPQPAPGGTGADAKPKPARGNRALGCGCLAAVAVGAVVGVVALTNSSGGGGAPAGVGASTPAAPAAASSCSAAALAAGGSAQAGFGTTVQSWDCTRNPDDAFAPGTVYGVDPALPQVNGHTGARYVAVQRKLGYVVAYQINFPTGTTIAAALTDILTREFPADASYLWKKTVPGQCYQAEITSATLAKTLTGTGDDDPTGAVFIEARTLPPGGALGFDPGEVTYADLNMLTVTSAGQAPGC